MGKRCRSGGHSRLGLSVMRGDPVSFWGLQKSALTYLAVVLLGLGERERGSERSHKTPMTAGQDKALRSGMARPRVQKW